MLQQPEILHMRNSMCVCHLSADDLCLSPDKGNLQITFKEIFFSVFPTFTQESSDILELLFACFFMTVVCMILLHILGLFISYLNFLSTYLRKS